MNNLINLSFDKSTSRLAGNPYGKSVYKEQLKDNLDFQKVNVIVFPDNIEKVASSFIQGLFEEIVEEIGYSGVEEKIQIKAKDKVLENQIYEDLFY